MHKSRTNANIDSQPEQLQRACHEPVCCVPESMDKHLPVPDCSLKGPYILGACYYADVGITTDTTTISAAW